MNWILISCILCVFGCFKDFRPSESFVTDYLTGSWKNFTEKEVNQEIYPIGTYSYFSTLVIVFLITDFVRYKPIIIVCGLSGFIAFLLMILGRTILVLQFVEFFYGLFLSTEVAYYTYIYAKVDKVHYQEVTSHTKAASLFGRCMSGIVAQLTTYFDLLDYHELNYITVSATIVATLWALFLPSVGQSIYFHRKDGNFAVTDKPIVSQHEHANEVPYPSRKKDEYYSNTKSLSLSYQIRQAYSLLWKHFLQAYSNRHVLKWSIWWALSTCGYLQVTNYSQLVWKTAVQPGDKIYNGAVDFLYAIIGTITVFGIGKLPLNWSVIGDVTVSIMSLLEGLLLLSFSYSYNIWLLYAAYIMFGVIYHTMVTVSSFEVAKCLSEDSHGLIFGVNIFFALLLESILTAIVVNESLGLSIREQYLVYVCYFVTIALVYLVIGIINIIKHYRSGATLKIWATNEMESITADGIDI